MKNYKIKTSFVRPDGPKARAIETGTKYVIFILFLMEKCLLYDALFVFQYGSEPVLVQRTLIGF